MKGKYIFLGLAISYCIVAIIQNSVNGALSPSLYVTIAFVSLELSVLQLLNSLFQMIKYLNNKRKELKTKQSNYLNRVIELYKPYKSLNEDTQLFKLELNSIRKYERIDLIIGLFEKVNNVINVFIIIYCTIQVIITPLKLIPYDEFTNKTLNVMTVFTFSVMFLSYFITNCQNEVQKEMEERIKVEDNISSYYLDVIERINKELEQTKGE